MSQSYSFSSQIVVAGSFAWIETWVVLKIKVNKPHTLWVSLKKVFKVSLRIAILINHFIKKRKEADSIIFPNLSICCPETHRRCFILTKWLSPQEGRYIFNSDGCAEGNPGFRGGGSILRDLWWGYKLTTMVFVSSMMGEARALLQCQGIHTIICNSFSLGTLYATIIY